MGIFSGLKIIDLTRVFSGPFATRHFADYGAEVIKVEPPGGDDSRKFPPLKKKWSGYFEILNRNKKSIFLNLKDRADLKKLYALCKKADVFVENFTSATCSKLQIDYLKIKKINPKIIYASIRGVSDTNSSKYYDVIAQAESGLISLNGKDDDMKNSTSIVDAFSGMKLAFAISSALYFRNKTGKGQRVIVSMKGSAFDLLEQNLIETSVTNANPEKVGNMDSAIAPFGVFKAKDGSIVLAAGNDNLWDSISKFLLSKNPKFNTKLFITNSLRLKHVKLLENEIEKVFKKSTKKSLIEQFSRSGVPIGEVKTMKDVLREKENYQENFLHKYAVDGVGYIVAPTGGISFSENKKIKIDMAPKMY